MWRPPRSRDGSYRPMPSDPGGQPLGIVILRELPNQLGLVLFRSVRTVLLRAQANDGAVFADGALELHLADVLAADAPAALWQPLQQLAAVLSPGSEFELEGLCHACQQVAEWAAANEAPGTAATYRMAAARLCADSPY